MSLTLYRKKRTFHSTTEPEGGKNTGTGLHFVVQKHDASHLHYDFRLEMDGVLKSWAVPKGPSLDPSVKRLAMMVEDHPYDYREFEGTIPEGNYGAGTVIVWDEGTYEPAEEDISGKKTQEKTLLAALKKNRLRFILHGKKLKGEFALVKTHTGAENAWLLMKIKDRYASEKDIILRDRSVLSGKTIEQVQRNADKVWKGGKAGFPKRFKPMLATRVAEPFDGKDWLYEIKWDGYRAVAYLNKGKVQVYSRNLISFNKKFVQVTDALAEWNESCVIDGEIVALDENGQPSFQMLQNHQRKQDKQFAYYVFDIIWYNGKDLTALSLLKRKTILESILPPDHPVIRYSSHVEEKGKEFFHVSVKHGLEGIMAKKCDSVYIKGHRSSEWLKIKNDHRMEAIICGFTKPRNSRNYFGAVILGKYTGNELVYIGHSGSGFTEKGLQEMYGKFKPLVRKRSPFAQEPKTNMPVTWLKPELVCEVKFTEWTSDHILRHPIFLGLREDKKAADEKNEKVVKAPVDKKNTTQAKKAAAVKRKLSPGKASPQIQIDPEAGEQVITVKRHDLKLTNLDKRYWPKEKITKRDLLQYYADISSYIMPYMKNRPQSLNRHPNGIAQPGFFHKNMPETAPDWIDIYPYKSDSDNKTTHYLVCRDEASLLYMASLGCIEMNPWHSRVPDTDYPDWCVIDLDPDTNSFNQVIETAQMVRQVLESAGADGYCKTSGSTGLHIYIPLGAKYTYDQSRMLAQLVVQQVHAELPKFTSLERSPSKRKGKIYLDYLQNKTTQTIAAPYSLRPKPGAPVSTPLHWDEVVKGLKIKDHNIHNIFDRLKRMGDIFQPVLGKGVDMSRILRKWGSDV